MVPGSASESKRRPLRIFSGDHPDGAGVVIDIAAVARFRVWGCVEVEMKDVRVRISADAPSGVIAATLKALRS